MANDLSIPVSVQRAIMLQLIAGNDVEVRMIDDEFIVIGLRKKIEKFKRHYGGEKNIKMNR